jgi:hypothetical protein
VKSVAQAATFNVPFAATALRRKYSACDRDSRDAEISIVHLLLRREHGILIVDQQLL